MIERTAKIVLKERFREGISNYYLHLIEKQNIPENPKSHCYYYMVNINKPSGELNYQSIKGLEFGSMDIEEAINIGSDDSVKIDMMIDLGDEQMVDFLINNDDSRKWIEIYGVMYGGTVKMDIFERILFDYIFNKGLSISKISQKTGNGKSYTYQLRKKLLEKLKASINNNKK